MLKFLIFAALCYVLYVLVMRSFGGAKPMGRTDAAKLLGVRSDASVDEVIDAHRRLIAKVHPDAGGNAELAAQINRARDTMLKA